MAAVPVESGVVLSFGGTNARIGESTDGDIHNFVSETTPTDQDEFFKWIARRVLQAADAGKKWAVAGFPGPVGEDGVMIGPMQNIPGLAKNTYNLRGYLSIVEPAADRLLNDGFKLVAVNDGELSAQAAASIMSDDKHERVAALIIGTGVGAGVVNRDRAFDNVARADRSNPYEIGEVLLSGDPTDTIENAISGPALERRYGQPAGELNLEHAWQMVGEHIGRAATMMAVMNNVDLVVPCGGVGAGAADKYQPHLQFFMELYKNSGSETQKLFIPEVIPVPAAESQVFELYGGEGVMRDFLTR